MAGGGWRHLPGSGAMLDQPAWLIEAMEYLAARLYALDEDER